MGKSENGPDMLDCLMFLHQLQQTYECNTSLLIVASGSSIAPSASISLLSVPKNVPPWHATAGATSSLTWPHRECKTFTAALYRLLIEHDSHLTMQKNFFKTWGR